MKLQDAFYAERNAAGNWTLIGYIAPTSTNFDYAGSIGTGNGGTVTRETSRAWTANNKVKLNDCTPGAANSEKWTIKVTPASATAAAGASIVYKAEVTDAGCQSLTPNFTAIDGTID
ncbi:MULTISPECIES: hypothetical protein [unclassified Fibrobacter]|uniref:hypothetical protein n=1 Tax=unclassified Fibrobacter TaxID=2634177 RepID=UPI000D6DC13E|nr:MULTISPECIES: hypothetical protein [unclassified Fibrobacter]PWJ62787.1 hypothetical protein BGX12_12076 [Fibrobacter sp. UWR4]PZW63722.1 hypothetical protein C8E88_10412 [Fibrobacter sp. UWR1]